MPYVVLVSEAFKGSVRKRFAVAPFTVDVRI
jgi:hypothetical protein